MTKQEVENIIDQKLGSFSNLTIPTHTHNAVDAPQIPSENILITPIGFRSDNPINFTPINVGTGTTITRIISGSATLNFGAILPDSSADLNVALVGAADGNSVILGVQNVVIATGVNCTNIVFFSWVSAADVVTIRCTNNDSALTANPANGTFTSTVIQF